LPNNSCISDQEYFSFKKRKHPGALGCFLFV
jgi:hypothetical protein